MTREEYDRLKVITAAIREQALSPDGQEAIRRRLEVCAEVAEEMRRSQRVPPEVLRRPTKP